MRLIRIILTVLFGFGWYSILAQESYEDCQNARTVPYYNAGVIPFEFDSLQNFSFSQAANWKVPDSYSGIVVLKFRVNCNGEIGMFDIKQLTEQYDLVTEKDSFIYALEQTLRRFLSFDWPNQVNDEGMPINMIKFYSFKFYKGQLIEVFPK